jgi:diphthamide biosynthesis methyltransferase
MSDETILTSPVLLGVDAMQRILREAYTSHMNEDVEQLLPAINKELQALPALSRIAELESELARLRTCLLSYGAQYPDVLQGNEMARKAAYEIVEKDMRGVMKTYHHVFFEHDGNVCCFRPLGDGTFSTDHESLMGLVDALRSKSNG